MIQANLFIAEEDPRKQQILRDLEGLSTRFPHQHHIINIDLDPALEEEFSSKAPVLDIGFFRLLWPFDLTEMELALSKAQERLDTAQQKGDQAVISRLTEPIQMTKSDRFSRWFSNHYMVLINSFTFLYVFLALLAPTLMKIGATAPAKVIYKIYSPLCHQLAFRSFFMFGEQAYYPRDLAGMSDVITYGQATGNDEFDLTLARQFAGNETMGYKMALCQRDIAIYGTILLFGILFAATGRRLKPLPWYLWLIIGLGPIGLDGFSQLLSQIDLSFMAWLPLRESTPWLRALTGAAFGLATAWFGFPYLEESVLESRREMALKFAVSEQTAPDETSKL